MDHVVVKPVLSTFSYVFLSVQKCGRPPPVSPGRRLDQTRRVTREEWRFYHLLQSGGWRPADLPHRVADTDKSLGATAERVERERAIRRMDTDLSPAL